MANVKNHFNQTPGPQGADDNELVLGGTVTQPAEGIFTSAGDNVHNGTETFNGDIVQDAASTGTLAGDNAFSGANTHSGTETFTGALETEGGADLKTKLVNVRITDISTAGSVWVVPGFAGSVVKINTVIDGAITVGDAVLDPQIGGTSITDGGITIANAGSAAGVVDQSTPTALNVFTATEAIEIATNGGSTDTASANITLELLPA